ASVEFPGANVETVATGDGLLTVEGLCEADGTRLLEYKSGFGIVSMSPNPSAGEVRILVQTVEESETSVELYTSAGERVFVERWEAVSASREIVVGEHLPSGVYTVILRSPARVDVKQLLVV